MTINLAKLRAAATIVATPRSATPDCAWNATARFFGITATNAGATHDEAIDYAIAKLAAILDSLVAAIERVSEP